MRLHTSAPKRRVRRGEIDYNQEIPFLKMPPKGFHEVSLTEQPVPKPDFRYVSVHLQPTARTVNSYCLPLHVFFGCLTIDKSH
jgi:hypothetical protein